jgi:REP element-mobilizing transposase RayT
MGIEVLGYAVMSNHFHTILRNRPDIVESWSDEQVARKWWMLCPARKNKDGSPAEPTEQELKELRANRRKLKEKRRRLSSISWFMRFLCERIAKESNKEDKCTGRFWEGRFKAQVLRDDAAILACLQYVDLNPIRAGIAMALEASDFTSIQDRIRDLQRAISEHSSAAAENGTASSGETSVPASAAETIAAAASMEVSPSVGTEQQEEFDTAVEHGTHAGWLSPVSLAPKRQGVRAVVTERRASNKGILSMGVGEYLQLLDWTARQIRSDKRSATPKELEPIFERLEISAELWVDCVLNFRKWFRSAIIRSGTVPSRGVSCGAGGIARQDSSRRTRA